MNVLLAVDGSADTKKMLAYLMTHDLLGTEPKYLVLNVQPQVPVRAAHFVGRDVTENYYRTNAEAVFAPVSTFLERHNVRFKTRHVVGMAAEQILKTAKQSKADIIVMGSHGRSTFGSMLLGSVAQKVLTVSDIPVLIVR
jgi:nucleotide-binding universal stress UspA family protein